MKTHKTTGPSRITRRELIGAAASVAAFTIVPRHVLGGPGQTPPSEKLNIACIGVGGKGYDNVRNVSTENMVALCDVDSQRGAAAFEMFPDAKRYSDYRRMLDWEGKSIDAVVVTTPNHTHIPASVMAMQMGKHVYCEKPLGHNIHEVRLAAEVARKDKVATQMGIGNHCSDSYRRVVELVQAGAIGEVRTVHAWCDPDYVMPPDDGKLPWGDRPAHPSPPVPEHLKWDLWLGPAPVRPYHPAYHPVHWRDWWDFGNGWLGDMGCHLFDLAFWALDLKSPLTVEAEGPRQVGREVTPRWLSARWTFAQRGKLPPVTLTWHHGGRRPELPKEVNLPNCPVAVLFVGSGGMVITQLEVIPPRFKLLPLEKFAGFQPPPQTIPRSIGHHQEWIMACKTGKPTTCNFDYSGPLTETVLLGDVAYWVGEKLEWDSEKLKATNCPEADRFIRREYRKGWTL